MNLKIGVKGSGSTSNYSAIVDVEIAKMKVRNVKRMITPVSDYDILLSMDDATRMGAVLDCPKNCISFPMYKIRVHCDGNSAHQRLAMTSAQEVPDFPAMFPEAFVKELPEDLPPVRKMLHRIILKDPTNLLKTPTFKAP